MLKLHHFRNFVAIADAQSVRGAARTLGLAQPYLSRSLGELEKELGVALLERHAAGVELTAAGARFLVRARTGLREFYRGIEEMEEWGNEVGGQVAIAMSSPPILSMLPQVFTTFRKRYPKVHLQLSEATFPAAEPQLRDGRLDFYIGAVVEESVHRRFERQLLFSNRRMVFTRVNHPLCNANSLADLQDAEWLYGGLQQRAEQDFEQLFERHGLLPPGRLTRVDSQMCTLTLMLNSDAIAMVPRQWAEAAVINQLVRPINLRHDFPAPDVVMVTRAGIPLTPSAEKLAALFIREAEMLYPAR